jgi:hypothetical protein
MLEQIEKLFPGFLTRVQKFPATARAVFMLLVLAGPAGIAWAYSHVADNVWVRPELRTPSLALALALLGAIPIALLWHQLRVRQMRKFLSDWIEYRSKIQLLCVRIDAYLIRERSGSADMNHGVNKLEELLPAIREYWALRGRLREHVFKIGEERLYAIRNAKWEGIKAKTPLLQERQYLSPFSYLLDLANPIAEWNLHHDEIWEALYITDECVEYLRFQHPALTTGEAMPGGA